LPIYEMGSLNEYNHQINDDLKNQLENWFLFKKIKSTLRSYERFSGARLTVGL
jgi:hypothetical protein